MPPKSEPDLLTILSQNRWRLDCRHATGEFRVMYYCVECGLWRPVIDTGQFFADARTAIQVAADVEEPDRPL